MPQPSRPPILDIILTRLATLFLIGTGGDTQAARNLATTLLEAYHPATDDELCLAASIIAFTFQSLEALSQAADPTFSLTRILRLRGGAVSLSRETEKARRRLTQLQQADEQPAEQPENETTITPAQAAATNQAEAKPPAAAKQKKLTWTQNYQQRQRDRNLAARQQRIEAQARREAALTIKNQAEPTRQVA